MRASENSFLGRENAPILCMVILKRERRIQSTRIRAKNVSESKRKGTRGEGSVLVCARAPEGAFGRT